MAWQRTVPFGYRIRGGRVDRSPAEAEAVVYIFARYIAGYSYSKIAGEMSARDVPYHSHTPLWNKNMVKRILENDLYLGTDIYPRLVSNEDYLAVQFRQRDKAPCSSFPKYIKPVQEKAVCGRCGGRMRRDTKRNGRAHWGCQNAGCKAGLYIPDDELWDTVSRQLRVLGETPDLLEMPEEQETEATLDLLRLENEINLSFNRADVNLGLMKTLIFAAAAERYDAMADPTPAHRADVLRLRLERRPAEEEDLPELLSDAVRAVRIHTDGTITLELVNGAVTMPSGEEEKQ